MFLGLGDKRGMGEITIYQSNLKRVEVEDLKGLEVVLLLSAMAIGDIWCLPTNQMFNLNPPIRGGAGGTSRSRKNSFPLVASPPAVTVSAPTQPQLPTTSPQHGHPPANASFAARFQQQQQQQAHQRRHSTPPDPDGEYARRLHEEAERQRKLAEQEQEQIRRMLAEEEARERRRREEEVNLETERLRHMYEQERQEHMARGARNAQSQRVSSQSRPPAPPRPVSQQRPPQQRPTVVGGSSGMRPPSVGGSGGRTGALKVEEGKKLNSRKSFLGLRFGGSSDDRGKEKEKDKRKKLLKKGSSMF